MVSKEEKVKNFIDFIVSEVVRGKSIPFRRVTHFANQLKIDRTDLIDDIISELGKQGATGKQYRELKEELNRIKELEQMKKAVKKRQTKSVHPHPGYDSSIAKEIRRANLFMSLVKDGMQPNEAAKVSYDKVYHSQQAVKEEIKKVAVKKKHKGKR